MVTASEMHVLRNQMKSTNHETYKIILGRIHEEIKLYTERNEMRLTAAIPHYVYNRPLFNTKNAAWYVALSLQRDGFEARVSHDVGKDGHAAYHVHVSWEPAKKTTRKAKQAADAALVKTREAEAERVLQAAQVREAARAAQSLDVLRAKLRHFMR